MDKYTDIIERKRLWLEEDLTIDERKKIVKSFKIELAKRNTYSMHSYTQEVGANLNRRKQHRTRHKKHCYTCGFEFYAGRATTLTCSKNCCNKLNKTLNNGNVPLFLFDFDTIKIRERVTPKLHEYYSKDYLDPQKQIFINIEEFQKYVQDGYSWELWGVNNTGSKCKIGASQEGKNIMELTSITSKYYPALAVKFAPTTAELRKANTLVINTFQFN